MEVLLKEATACNLGPHVKMPPLCRERPKNQHKCPIKNNRPRLPFPTGMPSVLNQKIFDIGCERPLSSAISDRSGKRGGDLRHARLVLGRKTQGAIASRLADGVTLPVGPGVVQAVIQFDNRQYFQAVSFAHQKIGDLPLEAGADMPLGLAGESAVIGEERAERRLRKHMASGQRFLKP